MEVQVGLLESDPKKKPRADASGAHVFSATRPPQVHRQSEQPPRYKTSAFHSDSELIRTEKFFSSTLTFGIFFTNSSSKARNNGASSQVSKRTRALFKAIELTLVVKILIRRRQRNNWEQLSSYRPPSRL